MNRRLFGTFGAMAVLTLTLGSCKSDPLSDLDGAPAALVTDFAYLQINRGTSIAVTASVLDGRSTPLPIPVTFEACSAVITVAPDTSFHPIPATASRSVVSGVTTNPSCVVVEGAGFTDTIDVTVLPPTFDGAISDTMPLGGDTLTIASTTQFKFDPAEVSVTFGGGNEALILSATVDTIKLLVPFGPPAPLSVGGIAVTYKPGLVITRPTSKTVEQTGNLWAGDTLLTTAPAIPVLPTTPGDSILVVATMPIRNNAPDCVEGGEGPCTFYAFTVADTTTLRVVVDWDGSGDVDIFACSSTDPNDCFEEGGGGAGASHPEEFEFQFPAGTHYLGIEKFADTRPTNLHITIYRQ